MQFTDSRLKQILLDENKLDESTIEELQAKAKQTKSSLQQEIMERQLLSEKELTQLYAKRYGFNYIDLGEQDIEPENLTRIPERISQKYRAILFDETDKKVKIAMADPGDLQAIEFLSKMLDKSMDIYITTESNITKALDAYKGNLGSEITKVIPESEQGDEEQKEVSAEEVAEDSPVAKTVNLIIEYALKANASDIHIEPRENVVQIRYRIDGVLREANTLPRKILPALVSRIKIIANLKIDEHRKPQDGRIKLTAAGRTVSIRISTLPVMDGEKVVMRLLDESARALTLQELGFSGIALRRMQSAMTEPHGLILVTGPTGSGKSTTLYSVLSNLNTPKVNISTVEDPVEYRIPGVNQTQVNPDAGMTFAKGLRALLRQDPDVIMVGEIRDEETAALAIQAALTGHLVLSTLHTNNAATALPRLLNMGAEPFLISSTVRVVVGQRLVRKLCPECKVAYQPDEEEIEKIKHTFNISNLAQFLGGESEPTGPKPVKTHTVASKQGKKIDPPSGDLRKKSITEKISEDPDILNRSAQAAQAQKITQQKTEQAENPESETQEKSTQPLTDFTLYKPGEDCDNCGPSGFKGRVGIFEVLDVSEKMAKLIVSNSTSDELQTLAKREGMKTMQEDGLMKAATGVTTIEEVMRVTRE